MALIAQSEQAPNPDSRVLRIEEKDALGAPKVRLVWRLSEIDKRTLRVMTGPSRPNSAAWVLAVSGRINGS